MKASDVISVYTQADALVAQYTTDTTWKGQLVRAFINNSTTYTAIATSQVTADNVTVYAIAGEEVSITLNGSDTAGDTLTYSFIDNTSTPETFSGTYNSDITIPYIVSKTVGDCNEALTATANIYVNVIQKPTVAPITIT